MAIYYTEDEVVKSDFLFASYKHQDAPDGNCPAVKDMIDRLLDAGVRLWYDTDLVPGDNWKTTVQGLIQHEKCKGVLFFSNTAAYMSEAIAYEREETWKRVNADPSFFILPVNTEKPSTLRLLKKIFDSLPDEDSALEKALPPLALHHITGLFGKDTLYCYAEDAEACIPSILAAIEKKAPSTVGAVKLPTAKSTDIVLGTVRGRLKDGVPRNLLLIDGRIQYGGETLLVQGGCAYEAAPAEWQILYPDGDKLVLISKYAVDLRTGGPDLDDWLKNSFVKNVFSADECLLLRGDVRLISRLELEKAENKDVLKLSARNDDEPRQWWIDAMRGAMQQVVREDGTVYAIGYNIRTKKACVRPVITVDSKALRDYLNR